LAWERAFESEGLDFSCYLSKIELDIDLPWDHIDAGINKSHLAKELKNAMDEKNTPVCQKIQCIECGGCSIGLLKEKSFDRKIQTYEPSILYYGKKSEREIRYRLKYSKEEKARYLSHGDVNNVIKRSFRRALIPVKFTKGFHPKMVLVFAPALPLGMAGKNEILEFRSAYEFSEDEFVLHVNAFVPSGFKVIDLEKIELNRPSLNDEIEYLEYSLEISQDIIKTIMQINIQKKENYDRTDYFEIMERQIKNYNALHRNELIKEIKVDKAENKVIFILKFTYNKSIKPQDMAKEIFGIENPVYYMARERIILKPGNRKSSKM
jgi:radical SAM-linked protein